MEFSTDGSGKNIYALVDALFPDRLCSKQQTVVFADVNHQGKRSCPGEVSGVIRWMKMEGLVVDAGLPQ